MYQPQVVKRGLHWYNVDWRKQRLVQRAAPYFNVTTFVETGTYRGDMTAAARKVFDRVYSIELHRPFFERAERRFAYDPQITILFGDSGEKLAELLPTLSEPCLFWLDAHGGAEAKHVDGSENPAPVRQELTAILAHPLVEQHVIMIDDAHVFVDNQKWGSGVWPEIEQLKKQWLAKHPEWTWKITDDVVMIYSQIAKR